MGSAAKKSVLAVDVGNTVTTLGLFDDGDLAGDWKLTTPAYLTADEAWLGLVDILRTMGVPALGGAILGCVVPTLSDVWREALARACTDGLLDAFGIRSEWLSRYPHELSGGELMRFCIARALLTRPHYLICDEISAMLDAVTQAEVWHALLDCADGTGLGLVIVSHAPALLDQVATRRVPLVPA